MIFFPLAAKGVVFQSGHYEPEPLAGRHELLRAIDPAVDHMGERTDSVAVVEQKSALERECAVTDSVAPIARAPRIDKQVVPQEMELAITHLAGWRGGDCLQIVDDLDIEAIAVRACARDAHRVVAVDRRRARCHLAAAEVEHLHVDLTFRRTRRAFESRRRFSELAPYRKRKQRATRREQEARHWHVKDPSVDPEVNPSGRSTVARHARSPICTCRTLGLPRSRPLT